MPEHRFATVVLVDQRGWILLQERDEHAPISPEMWSLVGGHVEEGETMAAAAHRELAEETGVRCDALRLQFDGELFGNHYTVWVAPTTLTDDDIVCGEGRQIVFVDPDQLSSLDHDAVAAALLAGLLRSPEYAAAWNRSASTSPW